MNAAITDSIINGTLNPIQTIGYKEPFSFTGIARSLSTLPSDLSKMESMLQEHLGQYVAFDFSDKPFSLNDGADRYITTPSFPIEVLPHIPSFDPSNPQEKFYYTILKAEAHWIMLYLTDYVNTAAIIDSRGIIKSTMESIYHLSLQLKSLSDTDRIMTLVRNEAFSLYYRIGYSFGFLFEKEINGPLEDNYYALFGSYPSEDILLSFTLAEISSKLPFANLDSKKMMLNNLYGMKCETEQYHNLVDYLEDDIFCDSFGIDKEDISSSTFQKQIFAEIMSLQEAREIVQYIDEKLEEFASLNISNNSTRSKAARFRDSLKEQRAAYITHLADSFVPISPGVKANIKAIPAKLTPTELKKHKQSARKILAHYAGYNLQDEKIMSEDAYLRLLGYVDYLIENSTIPCNIQRISRINLSNDHIQHTFYLIHQALYSTKRIHGEWITFIKAVFSQMDDREESTIRQKWASASSYDRDVEKMLAKK